MKNKIAAKLFLLFAVLLLIFSLVVGSSFAYLFRQHTLEVKSNDLEDRAVKIAQALSDSREQMLRWHAERMQDSEPERREQMRRLMPPRQGPMGLGYGAVLRFLGSAAAEDVWIIDNDQTLEMPTNKAGKKPSFMYKDLPPDAEKIVQKVLQGDIAHGESFSELLEVPTMTVGAPIKDKDGNILGAVLVHAPLSGMDAAARQGFRILLISGGAALVLAFLAALYFAWRFTRPLKIMQQTAEEMTRGDYTLRCGVVQNDEIGELGKALDSLGSRLLIASRESAQLDQMRKDFIANISHELRTPVTVIRGSLDALCDKMVTEPAKVEEYYHQMLAESVYLQRLINDLLDLSRLQNPGFQMEMGPLNLCEVVHDVARSSRRLALKKDIKIEVQIAQESYPLEGDYGRLRQMLLVFVDNALKFSPEHGSVTISLQDKRLEVTDHGSGVEAKDLPHIFERFYKSRMENNKTGTGLGLAIAREIAERHRMRVHMESEPGVATKVVVELP